MKTEADSNEIERFIQDYHIAKKDMDSVLSFEPYAN